MSSIRSATIRKHTTSSEPHPHVVYIIDVTDTNGVVFEVERRYSEFLNLQALLGDSFDLPAKRSISTLVLPSAWVDNALIDERKKGLQMYLAYLLREHAGYPALVKFLSPGPGPFGEATSSGLSEMMQVSEKQSDPAVGTVRDDPESTAKLISAAYYPDWAAWTLPPSKIDFSKFDILFFAFVTPNGSAGINWDAGSQDTLKTLVSAAKSSGFGTQIVLSVGGWGGSHWFSQAMSTATNRQKLVSALTGIVNQYNLGGVDIDWEYPNAEGDGNPHSSADSANLLSFFKLLRSALGPCKIISAAVTQQTWLGADGKSLKSVAEFASVMSFVNIMNYDVWGASANPGPNAPLGNLCGTSGQPQASAQAALAQWTKAGMPASKLLLGLPVYGYVSKSSAKKLSNSFSPTAKERFFPAHPRSRPAVEDKEQTAPLGDLSSFWGQQISFKQIVSMGALKKKADGNYGEANGYTMGWDNCSDTPYLFNTARTTVVTYDDTYSIASKTQFAKKSGMAGCFTWSLDQDDGMTLHNVMARTLGK